MKCYANVGTQFYMIQPDNYQPPEGGLVPNWILMTQMWPDTRPDRYGDWIAQADGTWVWQKYTDPPYGVAVQFGIMKNADTLEDLSISVLPGNVDARLAAREAAVFQPTP